MNILKKLFAVILIIIGSNVFGQEEGDRVMAIVGNNIITESDFQYQVQLYARQNQLTEISPYLAQQIFQSLLTSKIILAKAEQDSIIVTEDELNRELDSRIKNLIGQVGSQERLEEVYGMSLSKIRILLKEDLQKNLKIEKLKRIRFQGGIRASDKDVRDFFETYKDSLPEVSEEFELAHIILERKISDAEKNEAKRIAELILDSIKQGSDFSDLAMRNSGDSLSAIQGGDLGYSKKGTFVKEFEEAVFTLQPGEVSEVVETQFGYHIIKLTERQGDKVRVQHILIKFPRFESSDFETIKFLKDLKLKIENGEMTFDDAAKEYSEDEGTKLKGGYIGKIPEDQIDSNNVVILRGLSIGQISDPVRVGADQSYGYEIFKLINIFPPHKLNIDEDYDRIKSFTEAYKESKEMEKWINEIKESVYVDIKM